MALDLIDALRDANLDLPAARALLDRAASSTSRDAWLAILRDRSVPQPARRLVIRRLVEAEGRADMTVAELGALVAADAWLEPAHVRPVSVVNGKLPVQWLADDLIVAIDVLPAEPGDGDRHRLLFYFRVAGQPELEEVISGLCGGPGGGHAVREVGFFESEPPRAEPASGPRALSLGSLVMCRRALCDSQTGMHSLIDVIVELPVRLPGAAMFDIYVQLHGITGPSALTLDVFGPALTDDGAVDPDGELLTSGTLTLGTAATASGPPPPALGVAIPNVTVGFEHAGEHRLRVRTGDLVLGELRFQIIDASNG